MMHLKVVADVVEMKVVLGHTCWLLFWLLLLQQTVIELQVSLMLEHSQ